MVEFNEETLGKLLLDKLKQLKEYSEIISIVKNNSKGNIYLIGGTVSRTLAKEIYGGTQINQDFDFVVDKLNEELEIPNGWVVTHHKFSNPTFKNGEIEIDIFPFSEYEYIKNNKLEPTIQNFLLGVPFTIQALAFDIKNEKLIGEEGIKALKERKFKVNNIDSAKEVAKRKNTTINERMQLKAKSMGFEIERFD